MWGVATLNVDENCELKQEASTLATGFSPTLKLIFVLTHNF